MKSEEGTYKWPDGSVLNYTNYEPEYGLEFDSESKYFICNFWAKVYYSDYPFKVIRYLYLKIL